MHVCFIINCAVCCAVFPSIPHSWNSLRRRREQIKRAESHHPRLSVASFINTIPANPIVTQEHNHSASLWRCLHLAPSVSSNFSLPVPFLGYYYYTLCKVLTPQLLIRIYFVTFLRAPRRWHWFCLERVPLQSNSLFFRDIVVDISSELGQMSWTHITYTRVRAHPHSHACITSFHSWWRTPLYSRLSYLLKQL